MWSNVFHARELIDRYKFIKIKKSEKFLSKSYFFMFFDVIVGRCLLRIKNDNIPKKFFKEMAFFIYLSFYSVQYDLS